MPRFILRRLCLAFCRLPLSCFASPRLALLRRAWSCLASLRLATPRRALIVCCCFMRCLAISLNSLCVASYRFISSGLATPRFVGSGSSRLAVFQASLLVAQLRPGSQSVSPHLASLFFTLGLVLSRLASPCLASRCLALRRLASPCFTLSDVFASLHLVS